MPTFMANVNPYLAFVATLIAVVGGLGAPVVWLVRTMRRFEKKMDVFMLQHKLIWIWYCQENDIPADQEVDDVGLMLDAIRRRLWERSQHQKGTS
ncbi:MAG: hypothetical protein LAO20_14280 [Acidobacteriia bacterium]|nr:hypothetical protein [Terriglobia bacterium]